MIFVCVCQQLGMAEREQRVRKTREQSRGEEKAREAKDADEFWRWEDGGRWRRQADLIVLGLKQL